MEVKTLRLVHMKASELQDHPGNWRTHPDSQESALKDLISETGFSTAILYNETTGRIIDGHLRKKIALDDGDAEIPVLIGQWTEAEENKLLLSIDPIASLAQSDKVRVDALLNSVQTGSEDLANLYAQIGKDAGLDWIEKLDNDDGGTGGGGASYDITVVCDSQTEADEARNEIIKLGFKVR